LTEPRSFVSPSHSGGDRMGLDAIGIISEDPTRSLEFYKLLGIDFKKYGEHDHFEASTPSGIRIMLDSSALIRKFNPEWKKPSGAGVVLCFKQNSPKDVDKLYQVMRQAGFTGIKDPWDAFWGQRYACISDPDGNQVDLFASL